MPASGQRGATFGHLMAPPLVLLASSFLAPRPDELGSFFWVWLASGSLFPGLLLES